MRSSADMIETDAEAAPAARAAAPEAAAPMVFARTDGPAVAGGFVCDAESGRLVAEVLGARNLPAHVQEGGIVAAIEQVSAGPSPRLIIVDLSESTQPMRDIDALAEVCEPGTTVVALGTANDVTLYRDLLAAGVTDYLVKPLDRAALDQAVADAVQTAKTASAADATGPVIAVIGSRGGVGATSVAVNIGWELAHGGKHRVAMLDLDLRFGAVSLALDVEPGRGLREALENPDRIDGLFIASAAVAATENLYVLAVEEPLDQAWMPEPDALDLLLSELRPNFDCVVVDLPRSAAVSQRAALKVATHVIVVTDRSLVGMRDTVRLVAMLKSVAPEIRPIVVANRVGADKAGEIAQREFEKATDLKVDVSIPEDAKPMALAWHSGKAVAAVVKRGKLVKVFSELAARVGPEEKPSEEQKPTEAKPERSEASLLRRLMRK